MASRFEKLQRIKSGQTSPSKLPPPVLCMYLDEDRDAEIDNEPASCNDWTWGKKEDGGHGAIIMVKTCDYNKGDEVKERMKIHFKWKGVKGKPNWEATLKVDKPEKVRIFDDDIEGNYPGNCEGAEMVLGPPSESEEGSKEFKINDWWPIHDKINKNNEGDLWIEAVDFPEKEDGSDAYIELRFEFTEDSTKKGLARTTIIQTAEVRIAPWIMASDLIKTKYVCAVKPEGDGAWNEIKEFSTEANFVGIDPKGEKKPFCRDILKSGYTTTPANRARVLITGLDTKSKLVLPKDVIIEKLNNLGTIKGKDIKGGGEWGSSQTHGGNYLVTPPLKDYPLGRIVYGEDPKDKELTCGIADFLCAQQIQKPIILNPTWLSVGHVDELVAFIPAGGEKFKALLSSPMLAYMLMFKAANNTRDGLDKIIKESRDEFAKLYKDESFKSTYESFKEKLSLYENSDAGMVYEYLEGKNYKQLSGNPAGEYNGKFLVPDPIEFKKGTNVLTKNKFYMACYVQSRIDKCIREVLAKELDLKPEEFIDLPVAFIKDNDAGSGDSTNMLVLKEGDSYKCLLAKPFGPVFAGEYAFEVYIKERLKKLGIKDDNIVFKSNWHEMHINTGEFHCGTNQVPDISELEQSQIRWWDKEPVAFKKEELLAPEQPGVPADLKKPGEEKKISISLLAPPGKKEWFVTEIYKGDKNSDTKALKATGHVDEKTASLTFDSDKIQIIKVKDINKTLGDKGKEYRLDIDSETKIAVCRAELNINFVNEPENLQADKKIDLTLEGVGKDEEFDYDVGNLKLGDRIKVEDIKKELRSADKTNLADKIVEKNEETVAEIDEALGEEPPPPPPPPPPPTS